jgi:hypothetical protein
MGKFVWLNEYKYIKKRDKYEIEGERRKLTPSLAISVSPLGRMSLCQLCEPFRNEVIDPTGTIFMSFWIDSCSISRICVLLSHP